MSNRKPKTSSSFSGITCEVILAGDASPAVRREMRRTLGGKWSLSIPHAARDLAGDALAAFDRGFQQWEEDARATIAGGVETAERARIASSHNALRRTRQKLAALAGE